MESIYESKVINLLKKKGPVVAQEESVVFLLSVILEDFISDRENDERYSSEVSFARRLDDFLLDDEKLVYFDA